jgi:hypothetical protein
MKYKNKAGGEMNFTVGGQHYTVPQDGFCHIPDRFAYAVKAYGLLLEPLGEPDYFPPPVEAPQEIDVPDPDEAEDLLEKLTAPDPDPPKGRARRS